MAKDRDTEAMDLYAHPSHDTLQAAGAMVLQDEHGKDTPFSQLTESGTNNSTSPVHLIVFIRHFFCGNCEEYTRALTRTFPSPSTHNPPFTLSIIGCGDHKTIPDYRKRTGCSFPMYADPSRQLYIKLGMSYNLSLGDKGPPAYMTTGLAQTAVTGLWNVLMNGVGGMTGQKGGDFKQNGGEWLFQGGELKWCHRMSHTRDHAEVAELEKVL
ncbi:hypothetical protein BAUCODRAFT_51664, partial [Baudoinia panamericana UAMH 10762]